MRLHYVINTSFTGDKQDRTVSRCNSYKLTCVGSLLWILVLLLVRDVFVGHEEQNHLALLILNGYNVQKTPELCTCRDNTETLSQCILSSMYCYYMVK